MPSYDKGKLIGLLERKRAAYALLRDFGERSRQANENLGRLKSAILDAAQYRAAGGVLEELFRIPLSETGGVTRRQVEAYEVNHGSEVSSFTTGVGFAQWEQYLALRAKAERLRDEEQAHQERVNSQFAVIPLLLDAVKQWGFSNPELEV